MEKNLIIDLFIITPIAILSGAGLLILLYQILARRWRLEVAYFLTITALMSVIFYYFGFHTNYYPHDIISSTLQNRLLGFNNHLLITKTVLIYSLFTMSCLLILVIALKHILMKRDLLLTEIYALLLFLASGLLLLIASFHLITTFIAIELISLPLFVMASWDRKSKAANEAAIKYFVLSVFAISFFLLGAAFIYGGTKQLDLANILRMVSRLQMNPEHYKPFLHFFYIGTSFLFVGLFFKLAVFPFHFWVVDVYEGTMTIVTTLMASLLKIAIVYAMGKLFIHLLPISPDILSTIIIFCAICSMVYGNLAALVQNNLKRMFAYSSIAHSGYLLAMLYLLKFSPDTGSASLNNGIITSLLYYLFGYILSIMAVFCTIAFLETKETGNKIITLEDIKGLSLKHPYSAFTLSIASLSLAGLPPLLGFYGKFFLLKFLLSFKLYTLTIMVCITSLVGIYYYARVFFYAYWFSSDLQEKPHKPSKDISILYDIGFGISMLILGIFSPVIYDWLYNILLP